MSSFRGFRSCILLLLLAVAAPTWSRAQDRGQQALRDAIKREKELRKELNALILPDGSPTDAEAVKALRARLRAATRETSQLEESWLNAAETALLEGREDQVDVRWNAYEATYLARRAELLEALGALGKLAPDASGYADALARVKKVREEMEAAWRELEDAHTVLRGRFPDQPLVLPERPPALDDAELSENQRRMRRDAEMESGSKEAALVRASAFEGLLQSRRYSSAREIEDDSFRLEVWINALRMEPGSRDASSGAGGFGSPAGYPGTEGAGGIGSPGGFGTPEPVRWGTEARAAAEGAFAVLVERVRLASERSHTGEQSGVGMGFGSWLGGFIQAAGLPEDGAFARMTPADLFALAELLQYASKGAPDLAERFRAELEWRHEEREALERLSAPLAALTRDLGVSSQARGASLRLALLQFLDERNHDPAGAPDWMGALALLDELAPLGGGTGECDAEKLGVSGALVELVLDSVGALLLAEGRGDATYEQREVARRLLALARGRSPGLVSRLETWMAQHPESPLPLEAPSTIAGREREARDAERLRKLEERVRDDDPDGALEIASRIEDLNLRSSELRVLFIRALSWEATEDDPTQALASERARRIARLIPDLPWRAEALTTLARVEAEAGDREARAELDPPKPPEEEGEDPRAQALGEGLRQGAVGPVDALGSEAASADAKLRELAAQRARQEKQGLSALPLSEEERREKEKDIDLAWDQRLERARLARLRGVHEAQQLVVEATTTLIRGCFSDESSPACGNPSRRARVYVRAATAALSLPGLEPHQRAAALPLLRAGARLYGQATELRLAAARRGAGSGGYDFSQFSPYEFGVLIAPLIREMPAEAEAVLEAIESKDARRAAMSAVAGHAGQLAPQLEAELKRLEDFIRDPRGWRP